ncbi:MAG: PDZ domain-containing protein [Lachnospiraceae bacterium]|nr:PDZ domain-containing protein [Lachnospiraceae bacterium]
MDEYREDRKEETKQRNDGNISVPKPLFALLIAVLCGTMCYSAYSAGYLKGTEKGHPAPEIAGDAAENVPDSAPEKGDGAMAQGEAEGNEMFPGFDGREFFRNMTPFNGNTDEGQDAQGKPDGRQGSGDKPEKEPGKSEEKPQGAFLDIMVSTVSDEARESYNIPAGVLIMKANKDGAADRAGLKEHSVITEVDGRKVATVEELKSILADRNPGDTVAVTVYEPSENHGYEQKTIDVILSAGDEN